MEATERITFAELAKRLDVVKLFNKAPELDDNIYDGIINGSFDYCVAHEDCDKIQDDCEMVDLEIYQWYLISMSDSEYLKRTTDELIFYSEVLDEFVWGVTHYGTPWESVEVEVKI
jgi:hypothetical protein